MTRPLRIQFPGAFYHITCRGNAKKSIFLDNGDRAKFLNLLVETLEIYDVRIFAYILMSNHFHLLIQTKRANLSEFMRRFNISYTGWFNYRHHRCGHLYQGRYNAILVDVDNYLLEVSRYMHLNYFRKTSIKDKNIHKVWSFILTYQWSSLAGYVNRKSAFDFIDYDMILAMVGGRRYYKNFVIDGINHDLPNPFEDMKHGFILGSDNFISKARNELIENESVCEQPSYQSLMSRIADPDTVIDCVAKAMNVDKGKIVGRWGNSVARGIASELLYRFSSVKQHEIGELLGGVSYSAISQLRRRLKRKMLKDIKVKEYFKQAETKVRSNLSIVKI